MLGTILPVVAGLGLAASLVMMGLRFKWANDGTAAPAHEFYWVLSILALWLWWSGMSSTLSAGAKRATYEALMEMPVVSAAQLQAKIREYEGGPVVVSDAAHCAEQLTGASGAVAVKTDYSGQDEVEGEESDYVTERKYGSDTEIAKFTLGAADSPVRVDNDFLTVVAASPARRVTVNTGEIAESTRQPLMEYHDQRVIPCGASVSVTGLVKREGGAIMLEPLAKPVSILTDRRWSEILERAGQRSRDANQAANFWFGAALLAGALQLALGAFARMRGA